MKLYDHVFKITDGYYPNYTEAVGEENMRDYSNFMVNRVFSMDYNLIDVAQIANKSLEVLDNDSYVKMVSAIIPRGRYNFKYKKGTVRKFDEKIVDLIATIYAVPWRDAKEYYFELTDEQLEYIKSKFGL